MRVWTKQIAASFIASIVFVSTASATTQTTAPATARFDPNRAFELLVRQVSFGPRTPSSLAIQKTRQLIFNELASCGFTTGTQEFTGYAQVLHKQITGKNLYGVYPAGAKPQVFLSAHYDTRPIADADIPQNRNQPIPGANDGASGVAILLELARVISNSPTLPPVALVFFDAEDLGDAGRTDGFCIGSRYMAANMPPELQVKYGINIDIVGGRNMKLIKEGNSIQKARALCDKTWEIGMRLHPQVFVAGSIPPIYDDHVPFLDIGLQYIDIIDMNFPHWHTLEDTADKCSPDSLKAVAEVILEVLRENF